MPAMTDAGESCHGDTSHNESNCGDSGVGGRAVGSPGNGDSNLLIERLDQQWPESVIKQIPSQPTAGVELIREILDSLEALGWSEKDLFAIHMSLEEAVMNAIKHGNLLDDDKVVSIRAHYSDTSFYFDVQDQGAGFDPSTIPDPTLDENLTKPSGRGLMLMKIYMNQMQYSENGTRLELFKLRSKPVDN